MNATTKLEIRLRGDVYDTTRRIAEYHPEAYSNNTKSVALDVLNAAFAALCDAGLSHSEAGCRLSFAIYELEHGRIVDA